MATTYEQLATITVPSDTTSGTTFNSIPQTYTDLVLVISGFISGSGSVRYRINGSSSSIYYGRFLDASASAVSTYGGTGSVGYIAEQGQWNTTEGSSVSITHFFNYSSSSVVKTSMSKSGGPFGQGPILSMWNSTTAITSLSVGVNDSFTGTLKAGSVLSLYGIKAA